MKDLEMVIGLEIHVQTKTNSKMFCRCDAKYFQSSPNSHVCPVCLGLPGALPVPNKAAIEKCIKLSLALNCKINKFSKFDRKNYFYPDLPKGYQISQYDLPFGYDGFLEYDIHGDSHRIRITRVHQEEDTGKSIHENNETKLDFNKSGVPLAEIVTEPDFSNVEEVNLFAKRLKQIVKYLDISDADMEKGQMRFEVNISLREAGTKKLPNYKVEIKNIGSISVLEKVIKYEFERQSEILNKGETPIQETRGIKDMSGKTFSQRIKESSDDYRYFPEPDIPPIIFTDEQIAEIKSQIIELPQEKKDRYIKAYGIEPSTAETIISKKQKADWFEDAIKDVKDADIVKEVAKWFIGDVSALMKAKKVKLKDLKLKPSTLLNLVLMLKSGKVSGSIAKQILSAIFETSEDPEEYAIKNNLLVINDDKAIEAIVKQVIDDNPNVVKTIEKNPNATKFLIGQVMKATKGKANPKLAESLINKLLGI